MNNERLFAALYASEPWHAHWRDNGSLFAKTKCMVQFDRILTGQDHRILLNGVPLDEYVDEGAV